MVVAGVDSGLALPTIGTMEIADLTAEKGLDSRQGTVRRTVQQVEMGWLFR